MLEFILGLYAGGGLVTGFACQMVVRDADGRVIESETAFERVITIALWPMALYQAARSEKENHCD